MRTSTRLVLGFTREGKLVFGLAIGDLVDSEPLVGSSDQTGEVSLDILDVVELASKRVIDIDGQDFPVGFALIEQGPDKY